jgi:hypothetical protein
MKILCTTILCARILDDQGASPLWEYLEKVSTGGVTLDGLRFGRHGYWSSIEGEDGRLHDALQRVGARLLDEKTKQVNGSPLGEEVWTVP